MTWLNDILQGIFVGGGHALTAVGLSLMFGVMRLVNLAHGDLAVCATYLVTTVMAALGVPFAVALALMLPVAFAAGAVLQVALFDRALRTGPLAPLLVTFGLSIMIENLLQQTWSANVRGVPAGSIDLVLFAAQQVLAQYGGWYLVGIGALAIAVVLLAPAGLWGSVSGRRGWSLLPVGYRVRSPRRTP